MSVRDALKLIALTSGINALELRFSGNGIVGGLILSTSMSSDQDAAWVDRAFVRRFERKPVVSEIVLSPSTTDSAISRLQAALEATVAPPTNDDPVTVNPPRDADRSTALREAPQDIPDHFPSKWNGYTYDIHYVNLPPFGEFRALDNFFEYDSITANPDLFPLDWGAEIGITMYNDRITGTRPFCVGDPHHDFWSTSFSHGAAVWGTNVPAASAPYADTNIIVDGCSANSIEFGIGFPRLLNWGQTYYFFSEFDPGNQASSPASAAVRMISNDCNNLGLEPESSCMGNNTNRPPPEGFEQTQNYVALSRNWSVPGCAEMVEGYEGPILIPSGSTISCPSLVEF